MPKHKSRRRAGVLGIVVWGVVALVVPPAAAASAVCPSPPETLTGLIAPDSVDTGPLTEQFRPVYGVYPESAAGCWGGTEIRVAGFVASPEGLGGVTPFLIEPVWIGSGPRFLSTTDAIDPEAGPEGTFFPVAVRPSLDAAFAELSGRWVDVSGHFNDRAAKTCVVSAASPELGVVPSAEQAIEICRTAFVLTAIAPLTVPPTDTERADVADGTSGWANVLMAISVGVSLFVILRRPSGSAQRRRPVRAAWREGDGG